MNTEPSRAWLAAPHWRDPIAVHLERRARVVTRYARKARSVLRADYSASIELIQRLMNGMPGCPRLYFGVVDVRDVADLHVRAMTDPAARGERFIAVAGECMSMLDIARVLKTRLPAAAKKVPTRELPNWLVRVAARFDPKIKPVLPLLGTIRNASSAKAQRVLHWTPRSREEAVTATAESLLKFGLVT